MVLIHPEVCTLISQQILLTDWDTQQRKFHIYSQQIQIVNSRQVLIEIIHQPNKPNWKRAGRAYQLVSGINQQPTRAGGNRSLYLHNPNFIQFDWGRDETWFLAIDFVEWLRQVELKVWQCYE